MQAFCAESLMSNSSPGRWIRRREGKCDAWKIELLLLLLHAICCVAVWLGIRTQVLKVKKYLMFPVSFVPFWGCALCAFAALSDLWRGDNVRPRVWKS